MTTKANQTAARAFSIVLYAEDFRCPRAQLERRLSDVSPRSLEEAIATLLADGVLVADGDDLQAPLTGEDTSTVERLAAVVNVILATYELPVMTFERVCLEAERDPASLEEHREVLLALTLLEYCQLAVRHEEILWRPTRAATWAERLSI